MHSGCMTNSSVVEEHCFSFYVREQKEVIRSQVRTIRCMAHNIDVLSAYNFSYLSRCVRDRIVMVKSDAPSTVGLPDFLEDNW